MNPAVKKMWIEALSSGEYTQGRQKLHGRVNVEDTFCCLGVLCDLAVKNGVIDKPRFDDKEKEFVYDGSWAELPLSVAAWADIDRDPSFHRDDNNSNSRLSYQNDHGTSFQQIANLIEENL